MGGPAVIERDCVRCGIRTQHERWSEGRYGCRNCGLVDAPIGKQQRQQQPPAMYPGAMYPPDPAQQARAASRATSVRAVKLFILGAIVVGISGLFHCVHGNAVGGIGVTLVLKENWGFYDQIVDVDEIIGTPLITQVGRARTIRALMRAEVLARPASLDE